MRWIDDDPHERVGSAHPATVGTELVGTSPPAAPQFRDDAANRVSPSTTVTTVTTVTIGRIDIRTAPPERRAQRRTPDPYEFAGPTLDEFLRTQR